MSLDLSSLLATGKCEKVELQCKAYRETSQNCFGGHVVASETAADKLRSGEIHNIRDRNTDCLGRIIVGCEAAQGGKLIFQLTA